jgi:hypothetical protein
MRRILPQAKGLGTTPLTGDHQVLRMTLLAARRSEGRVLEHGQARRRGWIP